ncbi:hypothetical protein GCM10027043_10580 [Ferruginibacter profundus]
MFAQQNWQSALVKLQADGKLQYIADAKGNVIPDFSRVGYYRGDVAIPHIAVVKTIAPAGNNDAAVIQHAIDELTNTKPGKDGFRGAILLTKGIYKIQGTLKVNASGIILRGEGDATKLIATGNEKHSLIAVSGTGSIKEVTGTRKKIVDAYVPAGTKSFTVTNTEGLQEGDNIIVLRPGTDKWITDLKMDKIEPKSDTRQWTAAEYDLKFERIITKISGNTITIDNPVVMSMETQYGGGEIFKYNFDGRISGCGIENLYLESEFETDTAENHGWDAISFNSIENGWITNVTSKYFGYSCVNLGNQSKWITVDHCKCLDAKSQITGGRRYSFNNDGQMNLFMNCFASEGRHDYVTGAKVAGPNVFYNCTAQHTHADIGPHHRWAMGTLYDNIVTDGEINAQDRGNWGTGHGWSGVTQVFWHCTAAKAAIQDPWVSGKNYVIGLQAIPYEGRFKGRPMTVWEGQGKTGLQPASLFMAQLNERLLKK